MLPFTIVILGGIASGKSKVSSLFTDLGAQMISADPIAHQLLSEQDTLAAITATFGNDILDESQQINRAILASRVFSDPTELKKLEAILHPRVRQRIHDEIERIRTHALNTQQPRRPVVLLDIPLAAEAGWLDNADLVVFVDTDEDTRVQRAIENRGWTAEELRRRESNQMPLAEKRALAHHIVNNSHSVAKARNDVERLWKQVIEPQL